MVEMFDAIVPAYDRLNTLMTLGLDGRWRRLACAATELSPGDSAVDVACGTGKLSVLLAEAVGPFGTVVGVDFSSGMIQSAARAHRALVQLGFRVANALDLPYPADRFDAATIAFGIRNVADYEAAFREMARVVRPGGRVVCLELTRPTSELQTRLFLGVFRRWAPLMALLAGGRRSAYEYLPASLESFSSAEELAERMRSAGLTGVGFRRLATGVVALHRGVVPG